MRNLRAIATGHYAGAGMAYGRDFFEQLQVREGGIKVSFPARRFLGIINHTLKINEDNRFIPHNPCIVCWREQRNIAAPAFFFCAVILHYFQGTENMILKMGCFTAFCFNDRLYMGGSPPSGLKNCPTNTFAANVYQFNLTFLKSSYLIRRI
jgi:hypothetical protein